MMTEARGRYFDGLTAVRHHVDITIDNRCMELVISGDTLPTPQRWPVAKLRMIEDDARAYRFSVTVHKEGEDEVQRDPARLSISEPSLISELQRLCPNLRRKDLKSGTSRRLVRRTCFAVAALILILFIILPRMADTLAPLIPIEREIAFGKSVVAQLEFLLDGDESGTFRCSSPLGQAALNRMVTRLTDSQDLEYQIDVLVFDHEMINAFAAPGGHIVVLRGLLDTVSEPEELAGVLAHEIGHVERRDPTRLALRAAGSAGILSLALGDFSGGALMVFLGNRLLQASYTREAETEADGFALAMLNAAHVNSGGLADFFDLVETFGDSSVKLPAYFSTHPAASDRASRARANTRTQPDTESVLSGSEWRALKAICQAGPS